MASTEDPASVLEHFVHDVANLPAEISHLYEEMQAKDQQLQEHRTFISARDNSLQKFIKLHSSLAPNPKEEQYDRSITQNYDRALLLQEEKVRHADKAAALLDRHIKRLDIKIRDLQNDGSIPKDSSMPSLLHESTGNLVPLPSSTNTGTNTPLQSLSGNTSGGSANIAHAAISRIANATASGRVGTPGLPGVQPQHLLGATQQAASSANRSSREMSVSSDTKRRRLNANLALPTPSSNLARQSSLQPGTPRAGTPGSRAGSAGPRPVKRPARKAPPQQLRRKIGLKGANKKSRNRAPGANRASPSTTADDESVMSGEGSDEETGSQAGQEAGADGEGMELDEEVDDTKYCICNKVSHGSMVACDNDNCPYQWFHWACVGITEEPKGNWYCDHCKPQMAGKNKKKGRS